MANNYNSIFSRDDSGGAELPREVADQIITGMVGTSTLPTLATRVATTTRDSRIPVLSTAPSAYFVSGDSSLKQTTPANFGELSLTAEEIATLLVLPDSILADSEFDIWGELQPRLSSALSDVLDLAGLFGQSIPTSWGSSLVDDAVAAGNYVVASDIDGGDYTKDLLGAAQKVADQGFLPTAAAVSPAWPLIAASQRTAAVVANPLGDAASFDGVIAGINLKYGPNIWDPAGNVVALVADWRYILLGIRQDVSLDLSPSAVIVDDTGAVTYSAWQQDGQVGRAVMRAGLAIAKPDTHISGTRSPIAVVVKNDPTQSVAKKS